MLRTSSVLLVFVIALDMTFSAGCATRPSKPAQSSEATQPSAPQASAEEAPELEFLGFVDAKNGLNARFRYTNTRHVSLYYWNRERDCPMYSVYYSHESKPTMTWDFWCGTGMRNWELRPRDSIEFNVRVPAEAGEFYAVAVFDDWPKVNSGRIRIKSERLTAPAN